MLTLDMSPQERAAKLSDLVGSKQTERYDTGSELVFVTALNSERGGFSLTATHKREGRSRTFNYSSNGELEGSSSSTSVPVLVRGMYVHQNRAGPGESAQSGDRLLRSISSDNRSPISE